MVAPLLGVLLAGVAICLHGHAQYTRTIPLVQAMMLGVVFGPILEESFFRGCLLPVLAGSLTNGLAVILTALVFALFHNPANLAHWVSFSGSGVAYGWIRMTRELLHDNGFEVVSHVLEDVTCGRHTIWLAQL